MGLDILLLILLTVAALGAVMMRSLLRSAIALAITSAVLTVIMFRLGSAWAAVFELSVCTGLISVLFISAISLTQPLTREEKKELRQEKLMRFWYLPLILILTGIFLTFLQIKSHLALPVPQVISDPRFVLWNIRRPDLLGQAVILLSGVFAVVILFKENGKK